jgi:hypothetical protein
VIWRRASEHVMAVELDSLGRAWRETALGAGVAREISTVSGPTDVIPKLEDVTPSPTTLTFALQLLRAFCVLCVLCQPASGAGRGRAGRRRTHRSRWLSPQAWKVG